MSATEVAVLHKMAAAFTDTLLSVGSLASVLHAEAPSPCLVATRIHTPTSSVFATEIIRLTGGCSAVWMRATLPAPMPRAEVIAASRRGGTTLLLAPGATSVFPAAVVSIDYRLITARLNASYATSVGLTAQSWCGACLSSPAPHTPSSVALAQLEGFAYKGPLSSHNPRLQL